MKNRCCSFSEESGFALVELLIAGVIIAMTSSLLIGGLISANRAGEMRCQQAVGAQLLATQLALIGDSMSAQSPLQGPGPEPYSGSSWAIEEQDTSMASVKQIRLTLIHQGQVFHASTYRAVKEPQS